MRGPLLACDPGGDGEAGRRAKPQLPLGLQQRTAARPRTPVQELHAIEIVHCKLFRPAEGKIDPGLSCVPTLIDRG